MAPGFVRTRATESGTAELLVEYIVTVSQTPILQLKKEKPLSVRQREKYLTSNDHIDLSLPLLIKLNETLQVESSSKSDLVETIFLYSHNLLSEKTARFNEISQVIKSNKTTILGRAKLMIALCRLNDIPARIVTGLVLDKNGPAHPYFWVEIYDEEHNWQAYDPAKGYKFELPAQYLNFGYDTSELLSISEGKILSENISISNELDMENTERFRTRTNIFDIFDLQRLDFQIKNSLILLLLLPFCVILTAFMRHVLGFYPYGIFTAPLLALAMVYAEVTVTLILAGIVISLALMARSILPKSVPRAPRLTLIFTFVAMSMVLSVSVMSYFLLNPAGTIVLLPTVILVAIVDRFYGYMDKVSTEAAVARLLVTILISFLCIPILQFETLGFLVLEYPEVHFITAAIVLMFSTYKGKKLTDHKLLELFRENKIIKHSTKSVSTSDDVKSQ